MDGSQKMNTNQNIHLDPADGPDKKMLPTGSGRSLHIPAHRVADINSEKAVLKAAGETPGTPPPIRTGKKKKMPSRGMKG